MTADRYARQISVPGVGRAGQARLRAHAVRVHGASLGAEVAALYVAGAGVGRVEVDAALFESVSALTTDVEILAHPSVPGAHSAVEIVAGSAAFASQRLAAEDADPVGSGARAARWALARILSEIRT